MQATSLPAPRRRPPAQRCIIYALCDPRGDRPIKYVGQTRNGVARPQQYQCPSRIVGTGNPGLIQWLRELASLGLRHEYEVLEERRVSKDGVTINNAKAQGARPFTDGKTIFWTKPSAAKALGVSVCLVKEVLQGHQSRKVTLWYVDSPTLDIEVKL